MNQNIFAIRNLNEIITINTHHLHNELCNINLFIDDETFLTQKILSRICNNNYILRNKIMANTNKTSFDSSDTIPMNDNLIKFIQLSKTIFKNVSYITKKKLGDNIIDIKKNLELYGLPSDIDIVEYDKIIDNDDSLCYVIVSNANLKKYSRPHNITFKLSVL